MADFSLLKDLGSSVARILLPKSLEEKFNVPQMEPTEIGDLSYTNQRAIYENSLNEADTAGSILQQTAQLHPDAFKERVRSVVMQEIQSGNYDKTAIKAAVERNIKMQINNAILSKLNPPEASVGGFLSNFKRNTREVVTGIGLLLGTPVEAAWNILGDVAQVASTPFGAEWEREYKTPKAINHIKSYMTSPQYRERVHGLYVSPILNEYKEYQNPGKKFYEDPVDVALDASVVFGLAGRTLTGAGRIASMSRVGSITPKTIRLARQVLKESSDPIKLRQAAAVLAEVRRLKVAGQVSKPPRYAQNLQKAGAALTRASTPFSFKNISGVTKSIVRRMPGGEELIQNWARAASIRQTLSSAQLSYINSRNRILRQVDDIVKVLSDDEVKALPRAVEGFTPLPRNASQNFYRAVSLFRSLAKDSERLGIRSGAFTPEIALRRKWQPLANWMEREQGYSFTEATKRDRAKLQTIVTKAQRSLDRASKKLAEGKLTQKQFNKIKKGIEDGVAKAESDFEKLLIDRGFSSLTGDELNAQLTVLKRQFPEADPIYMRHFFADKPGELANMFLNTAPVRIFKPGSHKKTYNRDGYIGQSVDITKEQLFDILKRQALENLKFEQNTKLINKLLNDPETKPLKPGEDPLPGYVAFAPNGLLRFYRGTINLANELRNDLKKAGADDDVWEVFTGTVTRVFKDGEAEAAGFGTKNYLGVTKANLYQVPIAKATELQKLVRPANPYFKVFYDKPLDAFRFTALSMYPRWHINNIIGNMVFSIVSGDVFNPKAFYIYRQAKKQDGLLPDDLFGGIHATEKTTTGKLGGALDRSAWLKSTVEMHDKLLDTRVIGAFVRNAESVVSKIFKPIIKLGNLSFRVNQYVDDMFKGVSYVNKALKADRKGVLTRMTATLEEGLEALEKMGKNKKAQEAAVKNVHDWYYYGLNLMDFERRVIRRAVPFYSWMRWSTLYALRIATEAPVRANIISNMAQDYYMFTGQDKLPEWMQGSVPIGTDEDGTVYYLRTSGMNPFYGLVDIMTEGAEGALLRSSAPFPKTIFEQATGRDVFLGEKFTAKKLEKAYEGDLYVFDPELGEMVRVEENQKPGRIEHLLRNFLPQYILLETALAGGNRRYTAEGLNEIFKDLFRDPGERKAIIEDIITRQPIEQTTLAQEFGKAFGINIKSVTPEQEVARREALERATKAFLNRELPIMNQNFKNMLKQRIIDEARAGTPKEEIIENVKVWIGYNIEELKKLR